MDQPDEKITTSTAGGYIGKRVWFVVGESIGSGILLGVHTHEGDFYTSSEILVGGDGFPFPHQYRVVYSSEKAAKKVLIQNLKDSIRYYQQAIEKHEHDIKVGNKTKAALQKKLDKLTKEVPA